MMKTILCCPCKNKSELKILGKNYVCSNKSCIHSHPKNAFQNTNNIPILISEQLTDTVCSLNASKSYVNRTFSKYKWIKRVFSGDISKTKSNCNKIVQLLRNFDRQAHVLLIGGAEKGANTHNLWNSNDISITSIDIYASEYTDFVADAHYLPFKDQSFDGVWIQAVLEHVIEPNIVVSEIYRVLKKNGVVYAETPFMQQVHEGAYDFNRFTVLGHRYLFRDFELIEFGGDKGAPTVLAWSIKYFVWSLTRSRFLSKVTGVVSLFLLRPFGFMISQKSLFDSSSGVYFLGKKTNKKNLVSHKDLIKLYKGCQ